MHKERRRRGWVWGVMKRAVIYRLRRYGAPGSLTPLPVFVWTRAGPRAGAGCLTSAVPGGGGEETATQSRKPLSPSRSRGANVSETYCVPMATPWKEQPLRSSLLFCVLRGGSVTLAVKEVCFFFFVWEAAGSNPQRGIAVEPLNTVLDLTL